MPTSGFALSSMDRYHIRIVPIALYRVALMPIDTLKTVSQVEGRKGFDAVFRTH